MAGAWQGEAPTTEHTRMETRGTWRQCRRRCASGADDRTADGWTNLQPSDRPRHSSRLQVSTAGVSRRAADESKQTIGAKLRWTTLGDGWPMTDDEAKSSERSESSTKLDPQYIDRHMGNMIILSCRDYLSFLTTPHLRPKSQISAVSARLTLSARRYHRQIAINCIYLAMRFICLLHFALASSGNGSQADRLDGISLPKDVSALGV